MIPYKPEPTHCTKCGIDYDPIYMACPQCGYPAPDLPAFEAEPDQADVLLDCENGNHEWEKMPVSDQSPTDICVCLYCGMQRIRDLVELTTTFLAPYFGYPPDGLPPERYTPAYSDCTPEEIKQWESDLATHTPHQNASGWVNMVDNRTGKPISRMHLLHTTWGIGTYYLPVENPKKG